MIRIADARLNRLANLILDGRFDGALKAAVGEQSPGAPPEVVALAYTSLVNSALLRVLEHGVGVYKQLNGPAQERFWLELETYGPLVKDIVCGYFRDMAKQDSEDVFRQVRAEATTRAMEQWAYNQERKNAPRGTGE